jgi:hypothetical protein
LEAPEEGAMASTAQKATFALEREVLAALDEAVAAGAAPSKNALVERALRKELREVRRGMRREQWEQAARDPLFLSDLEDARAAFESADEETAQGIE